MSNAEHRSATGFNKSGRLPGPPLSGA